MFPKPLLMREGHGPLNQPRWCASDMDLGTMSTTSRVPALDLARLNAIAAWFRDAQAKRTERQRIQSLTVAPQC